MRSVELYSPGLLESKFKVTEHFSPGEMTFPHSEVMLNTLVPGCCRLIFNGAEPVLRIVTLRGFVF